MLTQARLKELLHYDRKTGVFTSLVDAPKRPKGTVVAGCTQRDGYVLICVGGRRYLAHRLAWFYVTGCWPRELDHKDRVKTNNRVSNLRECSRAQNIHATGLTARNTSGFKGVFKRQGRESWMVRIRVDGNLVGLGEFKCPKQGAHAYDKAAKRFFGPFALTNAALGLL